MPVLEYGPRAASGVTTLMAVGHSDLADALDDASPLLEGAKIGLMAAGIAALFGADRETAHWSGVVGAGIGLFLKSR